MRIPGGTLIPDVGGSGGCGGCGLVLFVLFVVFVLIPDKRSMDEAEKKRSQTLALAGSNSPKPNESRASVDSNNERRRKILGDAQKLIVGTWRYRNSWVTYRADGTKIDQYDNGWITKCFWSIEGDTLISTAFEQNGRPFAQQSRFRILELTSETLVSRGQNGTEWRAGRVK